MYRKNDPNQLAFEDFYLPFGGKLLSGNRWVILAKQMPWEQVEDAYTGHFSKDETGAPAKPSRLAFGALILKERLGVSDRERVAQITENPYLQYFLGLSGYEKEAPFHHSMLTHFRKRFSQEALAEINASIAQSAIEKGAKEAASKSDDQDDPPPKGKRRIPSGRQAEKSGIKNDSKGHWQTVGLFETEPDNDRQDGGNGSASALGDETIQSASHHLRT